MLSSLVLAYVGPGAGLSMIGTLLAVVGVFLLALLAPVLYLIQFVRGMFRTSRKLQDTK
jgi:uncharacterized membrane protein